MKKWKAILFGTLLTLSLCTFTACGTEVNNADETVDEKWRGIGIRIEDDVVVTTHGPRVLTSDVVKEIADIEKLMAEARLSK